MAPGWGQSAPRRRTPSTASAAWPAKAVGSRPPSDTAWAGFQPSAAVTAAAYQV
jgi:hypothetical protein